MALVSGRPLLEYQIDLMDACGILWFMLHAYMRKSIVAHFRHSAKWRMQTEYVVLEQLTDT